MSPTYEVHPATLDDFLDMLEQRENDITDLPLRGPRAWVYCTGLIETRQDSAGIVYAHRWVQAQFVYGDDLVTWKRTISNTIEMAMPGEDHQGRQEEVVEDARNALRARMKEIGMDASDLRDTRLTATQNPGSAR